MATPDATQPRRYAKRLAPPERRDQVLDAALRLVAEQGYSGVTMHAVARTAGVTRPVVYDFFANREELITALVRREEQRVMKSLLAIAPELVVDAEGNPDDVIVNLLERFLGVVQEHPNTWRMIYLSLEGSPPALREDIEFARRKFREQIEQFLAWAIERRGGPEGLDLPLAAHMAQAFSEKSARLVLTEPEEYSPERIARFVARLFEALERR